jgi:small-conductance mechanosensitive channel
MTFQIGDKVREGSHVGTVTDVGTMLIQLKTSDGTSRVVCPWELVLMRPSRSGVGSTMALE